MTSIVDIRLKEIQQRLAAKKITLELDLPAKQYLASIGYSPVYGARPLNRAMSTELLNPLSLMILQERIRDGEVCRVTFDGPQNRLVIRPNHDPAAPKIEEMDIDGGNDWGTDEEEEWIAGGAKREGERL